MHEKPKRSVNETPPFCCVGADVAPRTPVCKERVAQDTENSIHAISQKRRPYVVYSQELRTTRRQSKVRFWQKIPEADWNRELIRLQHQSVAGRNTRILINVSYTVEEVHAKRSLMQGLVIDARLVFSGTASPRSGV